MVQITVVLVLFVRFVPVHANYDLKDNARTRRRDGTGSLDAAKREIGATSNSSCLFNGIRYSGLYKIASAGFPLHPALKYPIMLVTPLKFHFYIVMRSIFWNRKEGVGSSHFAIKSSFCKFTNVQQ